MILCNSLCDCSHMNVEELRIIFKPILSVILVRCADAQRYVCVCTCVYVCACVRVCVCVHMIAHICDCLCKNQPSSHHK